MGRGEGSSSCSRRGMPLQVVSTKKRHPKFAEARAQAIVLRPGDTLVVPSGWWHYSVSLEPSVTLHHPFWDLHNRASIVDECRASFEESRMPPELQQRAATTLAQLRETITDDDDSDMDD